ncbi:nitronate monooxygenase [Saccharopolyspora sp. HNM0983]|uniref:Nitronate monooxygenase n=1 Tax=Saccharopolyspora montiporae TaxID=2781240 RepID=A0A929BEL4_9PSEU|nr:nitronate monooxygenase family protein [Saccharopolyspora sp. HNM0983]MBE9376588.1 nitronate monooxygenase [Saccharopolyspora sp. HNM0983]
MRNALTGMFGIDSPLVGFNRSPGVVAEVTKAGGMGVLAATGYTPEELDAQLTWIEQQVGGRPFGVDVLVPSKTATGDPADYIASLRAQIPDEHRRFVDELLAKYDIPPVPDPELGSERFAASVGPEIVEPLLDVAFSHRISLMANALGPPPPGMLERGRRDGIPIAALVGTPEHAARQLDLGVDLLVAQGTEAGGHTGTIATTVLVPEVVEAAGDVPVLAAGGIASGRQMAAALALGAAGVWCGSVWLSSHEDITSPAVKAKFLGATSSDTVRSPARTGKPARQLRSAWHDEWAGPASPGALPMPLQPMLVTEAWRRIDRAAEQGHAGARELESFFIGQVVGSFAQLRPAAEITREMIDDCREVLRGLGGLAD